MGSLWISKKLSNDGFVVGPDFSLLGVIQNTSKFLMFTGIRHLRWAMALLQLFQSNTTISTFNTFSAFEHDSPIRRKYR